MPLKIRKTSFSENFIFTWESEHFTRSMNCILVSYVTTTDKSLIGFLIILSPILFFCLANLSFFRVILITKITHFSIALHNLTKSWIYCYSLLWGFIQSASKCITLFWINGWMDGWIVYFWIINYTVSMWVNRNWRNLECSMRKLS